jgi:homoserine O-succinyltransferase/O-acetyltransferase
MPITVPDNLPSRWMLESEGIFVMNQGSAARQQVRPLRIALVQPVADPAAARAVASLAATSPLDIELTVIALDQPDLRTGAPPAGAGLTLDKVMSRSFDGVIVTHSRLDHLDWHAVGCWDEFRDFLDWSEERIRSRMFLGWSAQAALQHVYAVERRPLAQPLSGLHPCRLVRRNSFLMRGFDDEFAVSLDCAAVVDEDGVRSSPGLCVLAAAPDSGAYLVRNANRQDVFVLGQPGAALGEERETVESVGVEDAADVDGALTHASLLFMNWLNFYVYQPFSDQVDATIAAPR